MEPLGLFLAGLPLVLVANRVVIRLTDFDGEMGAEADARSLPWQKGRWPDRVRLSVLALLPVLMAVAGVRFDLLQAVAVSALVFGLLIITATDMLRFRVPNAVTYPGIVLTFAATLLLPGSDPVSALLAALLGGVIFFVLALITAGGIGLGDAKLAVFIGAALGFPFAYQALLYGIIAAAAVMLLMLLAGVVTRRQPVPYAPFLALAAVAVVLMQGAAFAPL